MPRKKRRTRQDYRTARLGTPEHYLLRVYPKHSAYDFSLEDLKRWAVVHGEWEGIGRIDMRFLSVHPMTRWIKFYEAIETIRASEHLHPPGAVLVKTLEWHQNPLGHQIRGITLQTLAQELGADLSTISRWKDKCVRLVISMAIDSLDGK